MILLIYTIFTVIAGSGGDSSDDDETPTIDINALNEEILNEDDEIHQMQNGTIDDVIAAGKTSTYSSAIKSISNWFFNVLNNEDRTKYQNVLQVKTYSANTNTYIIGDFDIVEKEHFVKQMEHRKDCCLYDYCLWKRQQYWEKSTPGLGHWGHVSALITNKLAEQPNPYYLSPEAATLKKKVIKGIRKQTGKFKNLKGIESNAKSPIPWEV